MPSQTRLNCPQKLSKRPALASVNPKKDLYSYPKVNHHETVKPSFSPHYKSCDVRANTNTPHSVTRRLFINLKTKNPHPYLSDYHGKSPERYSKSRPAEKGNRTSVIHPPGHDTTKQHYLKYRSENRIIPNQTADHQSLRRETYVNKSPKTTSSPCMDSRVHSKNVVDWRRAPETKIKNKPDTMPRFPILRKIPKAFSFDPSKKLQENIHFNNSIPSNNHPELSSPVFSVSSSPTIFITQDHTRVNDNSIMSRTTSRTQHNSETPLTAFSPHNNVESKSFAHIRIMNSSSSFPIIALTTPGGSLKKII